MINNTPSEQQLTMDRFPDRVRELAESVELHHKVDAWCLALDIMSAIKPELEKAFQQGRKYGADEESTDWFCKIKTDDFETWYQNTYVNINKG